MRHAAFDYVVIGAGSAGCVLAARLSEDPRARVLVLEAGGADSNPWIHIPIGYAKNIFNPRVNWCFETEPEAGMAERAIYMPAGKVLGGSSSINGLLYVRGQSKDFDDWEALGNEGWSARDVLPYFKRSQAQERGADAWHGVDGPLHVSDGRCANTLCDAFITAASQCGIPPNGDFNGEGQEGVGYFQMTARNGRRVSSSVAFLRTAMRRPNVQVRINAVVTRVAVEGGRATGVRLRVDGKEILVRAERAVVVSAGALNTPAILMRSGIGAPEKLESAGVPVIHALPGVGENLQDHLQAKLIFRSAVRGTLNDTYTSLAGKLGIGWDYLRARRGWLTSAAGQAGGFARTDSALDRPDVQFHVMAYSAKDPRAGLDKFPGFTISVCQLRPDSRGSISLRSDDPSQPPVLRFNYLQAQLDQRTMVRGLRLGREIAAAAALKPLLLAEERPGVDAQSDDELLEYVRRFGGSVFHPAGTCRMGHDEAAVVSPRLAVHGIKGLFVADASVMPVIVSGNTNAASIMIGERAADFVREAA